MSRQTLIVLLTVGGTLSAAPSVRGQQAQTAQSFEFPAIVVEGATLEAKPRRSMAQKPAASPLSSSTQQSEAAAGEASTTDGEASETGDAGASARPPDHAVEGGGPVSGVPRETIGTALTVVTGNDVSKQEAHAVIDVLRSLPGVSVSHTNGATGLSQIRIRGAEANHTLVLIDGVEANDTTTGEFDFTNLDPDSIEQIEVIRGPQSGLYGSGAVGGVINVITKSGRGPLTLAGSAGGGSYDTSDMWARMSGGTDRFWGSISYRKFNTEGFNIAPVGHESDSGEQRTFALRAGARVTDDVTVDLSLRNMKSNGDRDGFGGTATLATAVDDRSTFASDIWLAGIKVRWDMLDGALSHVIAASNNRTSRTDTDLAFPAFPFRTSNDSETIKASYLSTLKFDTPSLAMARHSISGMVEHTGEDFTPTSDFEDGQTRSRRQLSTIGEYRGTYFERLHIAGSIRRDQNDTFDNFTTWQTNASLLLSEMGLRPHASTGTGVKMPTAFEQFGSFPSFFIPNPNLQPEESFGWDAGLEAKFLNGKAVVDVTYFNSDLNNQIKTVGFPSTPINVVGVSRHRGVEVSAQLMVTAGFSLGASYTYLDAADAGGAQEIRRPPHAARADLNYSFAAGAGRLSVSAIYNGEMTDSAFRLPTFTPEIVTLSDYWLVNAAASYKLAPGVEVFGRIDNILDRHYQEIYGFETAGLAAFAGIRFSYDEPLTADWARYK